MKKFLTLVLSAAMLASLAGCSSKNPVKTVEVDETKSPTLLLSVQAAQAFQLLSKL